MSRSVNLDTLFELDIFDSINKNKILNKDLLSGDNKNNQTLTFSIMRDSLQKLLYDSIKNDIRVKVIPNVTCVSIVEGLNEKVKLEFSQGRSEFSPRDNSNIVKEHDLVFCADGIKSIGTEFIINDWKEPLFALYDKLSCGWKSNLRISYGLTSIDDEFLLRRAEDNLSSGTSGQGKFHQYFGDGCYVLCASYGGFKGVQHMLVVVYQSNNNDNDNPSWSTSPSSISQQSSSDKRRNRIITADDVKMRLDASGLMSVLEVRKIYENCLESRWIDLGVSDRVLPMRHWSSRSSRVVLLGDSAHAM